MMKIALSALAAATILATGSVAEPAQRGLHGLFCASEAHLDAALLRYRAGERTAFILSELNRFEQVCTFVDRIAYVVTAPVELGRAGAGGPYKYRATLVAVQVGTALRPIEPPVAVFLFRETPLVDAAMET